MESWKLLMITDIIEMKNIDAQIGINTHVDKKFELQMLTDNPLDAYLISNISKDGQTYLDLSVFVGAEEGLHNCKPCQTLSFNS